MKNWKAGEVDYQLPLCQHSIRNQWFAGRQKQQRRLLEYLKYGPKLHLKNIAFRDLVYLGCPAWDFDRQVLSYSYCFIASL